MADMNRMVKQERFPVWHFAIFALMYSASSIYSTYISLYFVQIGLSKPQIGMIVSVSTLAILVSQLFWGVLSDRSSSKNKVVILLLILSAGLSLMYYLDASLWYMLLITSLFTAIYNPVMPLLENLTLETLEGSRWDFGKVRIGGTIGYIVTVLLAGYLLNDRYEDIFIYVSLLYLITGLVGLRLPKVHRVAVERHRDVAAWRQLFGMKHLYGILAYSLILAMGFDFFHTYYPIFLTDTGGSSGQVGLLMFTGSLLEIPVLFLIHHFIKKYGYKKTLMLAGLTTSLRWFLLSLLRHPLAIILANTLHSVGYIGYFYSIITYINETVPKNLRATSQSINGLVAMVLPRVLFGFLGGYASEQWGTPLVLLMISLIILAATLIFMRYGSMEEQGLAEA